MSAFKNVMLLGAGGNVGKKVLPKFANQPFNVSVLTRPTSTSTFPAGINVVKAEYNKDALTAAFKGQDIIISMISGEGFRDQIMTVDAAIAAGVKRFVPSEFGSDTSSADIREQVPIFKGKRAVVEHLMKNEDKIEWTGVITGWFFDLCLQWGLVGFDFKAKKATIVDTGDTPTPTTTLDNVGRAVVGICAHPAETKNKYIFTTSFVTSQNEMLAIVEKVTGSKFERSQVSSKTLHDENVPKLAKGDMSVFAAVIQAHAFGDGNDADYTKHNPVANELLGLAKEDLEEEMKKALSL